ncbi:LysM peptidoglycan-binding domain-containing protein [Ligilactobacillus sp. Marseille-Q7487]|uniref:aggregation-promoting factor n=1 Tax=Ligilactobacillus sp. Marseille-Q7487 TaxID=3022128 RepID=UPI0015B61B6A|nr:LysM peptidoglycan-binding domain-containing protein [Ligilactobacillus sp. Marseille-Q7487]
MDFKKAWVSLTATLSLIAFFAIAASAATVTVKPGDTLSDIALKYNTTVTDIKLANPYLEDVNKIFPGQKIEIVPTSGLKDEARQQELAQLKQRAQEIEAQRQAQIKAQQEAEAKRQAELQAQEEARRQQEEQQRQAVIQAQQSEEMAKQYVASRESGGSYTARNGIYYGKYQLTISYLNGDLSPANQERVAQQYVMSRYGSWQAAKAHWDANGWF